jgi:hypothetical protein
MKDRTREEHTMKRIATVIGIAAALAVPSVASAGNIAQVSKPQIVKAQIHKVQIVKTQRHLAARVTLQRATAYRIALLRTAR